MDIAPAAKSGDGTLENVGTKLDAPIQYARGAGGMLLPGQPAVALPLDRGGGISVYMHLVTSAIIAGISFIEIAV